MKHTVLPESFLKRMAIKDRQSLGKSGITASEANEAHDKRLEKELQRDMANYLRLNELFFVQSRMDKKTSLPLGMPDFFIFLPGGRFLAVEAKVAGGAVSEEQKAMFAKFKQQTGEPVHVIWNLDQFRKILFDSCGK